MPVNVVMPQLGESVVEGTISKWLIKEGDRVTKDQPIVEVSTDKADSEVPSPAAGVVTRILVPAGQTVPTNTQIAVIDNAASAGVGVPSAGVAAMPAASAADVAAHRAVSSTPSPLLTAPPRDPEPRATAGGAGSIPPQSPAVRKLVRELGVEITQVTGSGERGRVTKQDVLRAASAAPSSENHGNGAESRPAPAARPAAAPPAAAVAPVGGTSGLGAFSLPPYVPQPGDEVIPFSRRRRIIADHMVYSKHVAPHVMTLAEIDMHKTSRLRDAKKGALKAEGIGLTFLAFVAAATVRALRENPLLNSRVLDDAFVKLKHINLGIAVETPQGLVVPVVRDADNLTVRGLARAIDEVAIKARDGKITADDLKGATFTISNPGARGNLVGAAIISQPNVGILRIGEIVKRPVVVEVDGQDTIAIHPVMFAALSYDHRIVDGVAANNFLFRLTELLEAGTFEI